MGDWDDMDNYWNQPHRSKMTPVPTFRPITPPVASMNVPAMSPAGVLLSQAASLRLQADNDDINARARLREADKSREAYETKLLQAQELEAAARLLDDLARKA